MIKFGNNDTKLYLGANEVSSIYLGSTQVYDGGDTPTPPTPSYDTQYFTTESTSDNNTIKFRMGTGMSTAITTAVTSVSVSTDDGVTWTSMENIGANASLSVTLNNGDKAIWKGEAQGYSIATATTRSTLFSSTGNYKVYGNITSLLYGDDFLNQNNPTLPDFNCFTNLFYSSTGLTDASNLIMHFELPATTSKRQLGYLFYGCTSLTTAPELKNIGFGGSQYTFRNMFYNCSSLTTAPELTATTLTNYCYQQMFWGCTSLTTAPELPATTLAQGCYYQMFRNCTGLTVAPELPATALATYCYQYMFYGCTSLTTAHSLPATTLASNCYAYMFQNCTSLTTAPELSATTLAESCYNGMFQGCTSLTVAPELPAATLTSKCYGGMFNGCTSLDYIKCLATDISATQCTINWVSGVASSGTFVKDASMDFWTTGTSGIPNGWTVQNDDGSPVIDDNDPIGGEDAD